MNRTAARLLVDCLVEQGCDRVFTVPGESFLPVLDALRDCAAIQTVTCRQEGGAAFMACGDVDSAMRDREGFQEVDFPAFFAPLAKWAARIDDVARIPEYLARAYATAI